MSTIIELNKVLNQIYALEHQQWHLENKLREAFENLYYSYVDKKLAGAGTDKDKSILNEADITYLNDGSVQFLCTARENGQSKYQSILLRVNEDGSTSFYPLSYNGKSSELLSVNLGPNTLKFIEDYKKVLKEV